MNGSEDGLEVAVRQRTSELIAAIEILQRQAEDRSRAEDALRSSEARLAVELEDMKQLQQVSSQLIREDDVAGLCTQLVDAATTLMRSEMGSMQKYDMERNELKLLASKGVPPEAAVFWTSVRIGSGTSCGEALRQGQRIIVEDMEDCPFIADPGNLHYFRLSGIRSVQSTPLIARSGRFVGMISTHWKQPHQPSERELRLLDVVARQAADLIERMDIEQALRESEARQVFLLRLSDALRALDDPMRIQTEACRLLGEHLNVNRTGYADIDGDDFIARPGYVNGVAPMPSGPHPFAAFGESLVEAYRRGETIVVDDVGSDPSFTPAEREVHQAAEIAAFVGVMLIKGGRWVGAFGVSSAEPRCWSGSEVQLIREVADRVWEAMERARAEEALRASEQRLRLAIGTSRMFAWEVNLARQTCKCSDNAREVLGFPLPSAMDGVWQLQHPEDLPKVRETFFRVAGQGGEFQIEHRFVDPLSGESKWVLSAGVATEEAGVLPHRLFGVTQNIVERKQDEARLQFLATHDALTGLPNRTLLQERLQVSLARSQRAGTLIALLYIDLDHFKPVNDSLGHAVGDELLQEASARIAECIRKSDTLARIGGDEFAVLLDDIHEPQEAGRIAGHIIGALNRSFHFAGQQIYISASAGIACAPADGKTADALLRHADAAMYRAKEEGKNDYRFFSKGMDCAAKEKLFMSASLRRALERNELALVYQPCIDARSGRIVSVEALIRWHTPGRGLILPSRFVGLAEEIGMIEPIGEWALRTSCRQLVQWKLLDPDAFYVAVNISARHFRQPRLAQRVDAILNETGVKPACLELEITESVVMANPEKARQTLAELAELGVRLALDDFGTGHSSLAYLQRFPVHRLKIDQSFVHGLPESKESGNLTRAIIAMARSLGLKVTAEGVEREAQRNFLLQAGCDTWQGYLFSMPAGPEAVGKMLA